MCVLAGAVASGEGTGILPSHSPAGRELGSRYFLGPCSLPLVPPIGLTLWEAKGQGRPGGAFFRRQPPRAENRLEKGAQGSGGSMETFQHRSPVGGRKVDIQAGGGGLVRSLNLHKSLSMSLLARGSSKLEGAIANEQHR